MEINKFNEEVLFAKDKILKLNSKNIDFLINNAKHNKRKRIRLCAHKSTEDKLHEMFIVHPQGTYIRPHRHLNAQESLHIIRGYADLVLFDEKGNVCEVLQMGDCLSGKDFYHRIPDSYYHTLIISSDFLVFHETKSGPFRKEDTIFPDWAPYENDSVSLDEFMARLIKSVNKIIGNKNG